MTQLQDNGCRFLPRLLRLRDAPFYLGMDKNRFNTEVRPYITEIRMGEQGIAFDRLDLDDWADQYKARNGRPGRPIGDQSWDGREHRGSQNERASGTSTSNCMDGEFARALEQIALKRPNASLPTSLRKPDKQASMG